MRAPEASKAARWNFEFSKEELLALHRPDLEGVLRLGDFKTPSSLFLYSFAHRTLGYELWLREVRLAFEKRLFHTVRDTIRDRDLLGRLDALAEALGRQLAAMADREADPFEPPQPIRQALLVRARNEAQARELARYLEAAEVVLGEAVASLVAEPGAGVRGGGSGGAALAEACRAAAAASYLPVVKTYYRQRAAFLDYLAHAPGTPFYPGRPPKRKLGSTWGPAGRRPRRDAVADTPWRPVYRPWADGGGVASGADIWAEHERHAVEYSRLRPDRQAGVGPSTEAAMPPGLSLPPGPVRGLAEEKVSVHTSGKITMPGNERPDDGKTGIEGTGQHLADAGEADDDHMVENDATAEADRDSLFDTESEEDSERKGSDTSSDEEPDRFLLLLRAKKRMNWRGLPGQGDYKEPHPLKKLPKVNGGHSWKRHYEQLRDLLEQARANNDWDNYMQDEAAMQAVAQIGAECRALAPAAAKVRDGTKRHKLGYGSDVLAKSHAEAFFGIRKEIEKARRFIWRSADNFADGILYYQDNPGVAVGVI